MAAHSYVEVGTAKKSETGLHGDKEEILEQSRVGKGEQIIATKMKKKKSLIRKEGK